MTSIYRDYILNKNFNSDCPVCLESINESTKPLIAHENGGEKHPIHLECAKLAASANKFCPTCRTPTDINSLFTWKERCIIALKGGAKELICISRDALLGLGVAVSINLSIDVGYALGARNAAFASSTPLMLVLGLGLLQGRQIYSRESPVFSSIVIGALASQVSVAVTSIMNSSTSANTRIRELHVGREIALAATVISGFILRRLRRR